MQFDFSKSGCLQAPGLAIGTSTTTAKYGNTFQFKANGRISLAISTADGPTLLNAPVIAPYPAGVTVKSGTLKDEYYRVYALVATMPETGVETVGDVNPTIAYSWIASQDVSNENGMVNISDFPVPDKRNQAIIGWIICVNESGSDFVPGTTALSSITTSYIDNVTTLF